MIEFGFYYESRNKLDLITVWRIIIFENAIKW